ncbi:hypothetical protein NC652_020119 [Populus alba x Populus x berolinensis]|nr:hypothetical protein NC652_020119 [Populus alba x Populus x berolinensis]
MTFLVEDFRHYFKEQIDWLFSARLKKLGFSSLFDESCYVDMQGNTYCSHKDVNRRKKHIRFFHGKIQISELLSFSCNLNVIRSEVLIQYFDNKTGKECCYDYNKQAHPKRSLPHYVEDCPVRLRSRIYTGNIYICEREEGIPVTNKHGKGIEDHDTNESCYYRSPDNCVKDPIPSDDVHGQVQINQNNHRECPKVSDTWHIDGARPICKERDEKDNHTLPQSVQHC